MPELKPLTREAVPRALEKAERYRLLNEAAEAESICLDVLAADPGNQRALVTLLLALTDQFDEGLAGAVGRAHDVAAQLSDEYERTYYEGIIWERRAKAKLKQGGPGSGYSAFDALEEAMRFFEQAEGIRPAGNDDARLRWNTCARILQRSPGVGPAPDDWSEPPLE